MSTSRLDLIDHNLFEVAFLTSDWFKKVKKCVAISDRDRWSFIRTVTYLHTARSNLYDFAMEADAERMLIPIPGIWSGSDSLFSRSIRFRLLIASEFRFEVTKSVRDYQNWKVYGLALMFSQMDPGLGLINSRVIVDFELLSTIARA